MHLKTKSPAQIALGTAAIILTGIASLSAHATALTEFAQLRRELNSEVREKVLETLNGPDGTIFTRKGDAFFRSSLKSSPLAKLATDKQRKTKVAHLKPYSKLHLEEMADQITELLMADALVGDDWHGSHKSPKMALTPHMNKVDVSQLDILIRDPNFQVLHAQTVKLVSSRLENVEKNFPDGEAKTRYSRLSCSDDSVHGGLTEYSLYDSETQTLEFCSRYLPLRGDLASWEAHLSPNAEREPASVKKDKAGSNGRDDVDFAIALAPDETIASTDIDASPAPVNGALNLHPEVNGFVNRISGPESQASGGSTYAGRDEVHRGPASLAAAEQARNNRLARHRKPLPVKSRAATSRVATGRPAAVNPPLAPAPHGEVHSTTSSSVAAVSGQLSSNTGIRRSQIPSSVHEGFEFRMQFGRLITTFWVVNRGANYDLVYANSSGSRVSVGIPVTSFAYLQETAEAVHHDVNDISNCPSAKIQMHIVSEGEQEKTIAACVQGKTRAAADLRAMGNLLSTLVR